MWWWDARAESWPASVPHTERCNWLAFQHQPNPIGRQGFSGRTRMQLFCNCHNNNCGRRWNIVAHVRVLFCNTGFWLLCLFFFKKKKKKKERKKMANVDLATGGKNLLKSETGEVRNEAGWCFQVTKLEHWALSLPLLCHISILTGLLCKVFIFNSETGAVSSPFSPQSVPCWDLPC